jgi:BirA family biotin operon repressor/biotin-[acetyl-CoA-carboxylase] ligase
VVTARVHRYDTVASTMDLLHQLAAAGASPGTIVVAAEQTAGRGSRGRSWHSPRGGLWLSLLLRPAAAGSELLGIRTGLAVAEALETLRPGLRVELKWPNDLLLGDRKLGGVLCEARWVGGVPAWVAIGIGINVTNPIPAELRGVAVALSEVVPEATPDLVLERLLPRLESVDGVAPLLDDGEQARLATRDWLAGRRVSHPAAGVVAGVLPDGSIRIRRDDGSIADLRAGTIGLAERSGPP